MSIGFRNAEITGDLNKSVRDVMGKSQTIAGGGPSGH